MFCKVCNKEQKFVQLKSGNHICINCGNVIFAVEKNVGVANRVCGYCKKVTPHKRRDEQSLICQVCGSIRVEIMGFNMDLM